MVTDSGILYAGRNLHTTAQMRWAGFRKVRNQVCKRIQRRIRALDLADVDAYLSYLNAHTDEWAVLDRSCRITISRFYRDPSMFDLLRRTLLPDLAESLLDTGRNCLNCWSIGCGSGEEPYSLAIVWELAIRPRFPDLALSVLATDTDLHLLDRARRACYSPSSVKDLPDDCKAQAFARESGIYRLQPEYKKNVLFLNHDLRTHTPRRRFDLILCRNLAMTYFDTSLQIEVLEQIWDRLLPGGAFVVGIKEALPTGFSRFEPWHEQLGIYRRSTSTTATKGNE